MIQLKLNGAIGRPLQVLCFGSHADDIEIGCGGAILKLASDYPDCEFHWVVFCAVGPREAEAQRAAPRFVAPARLKGPMLKTFKDGFMPYNGGAVKEVFEDLKRVISPDLIFTHNRRDAHQDHRLVSELTWNTFRNHLILEYEIPKYDGDMGQPEVFIPLTMEQCETKVRLVMESFPSQHSRTWFQRETFLSLMKLRGMECNAASGYAEAFYARKLVL